MQIFVDADACPVVDIVETIAEKYNISTTLLCDTYHILYSDYSEVIVVSAGADAVVAEGMESGGHIGSITTFALVPQVVDAVQIPVVAAGGIADGRGMAAAFMLGAEGVQMGTRFVAAKESIVHANYKEQLIKAKDIDSAVTGMSTGHPVRSIRNKMTKEYLRLEKEGADFMELEKLTLGSLRKAVIDGDVVNGTVMAGQIAGLIKKEESCKEIISEIMEQADRLMSGQQ